MPDSVHKNSYPLPYIPVTKILSKQYTPAHIPRKRTQIVINNGLMLRKLDCISLKKPWLDHHWSHPHNNTVRQSVQYSMHDPHRCLWYLPLRKYRELPIVQKILHCSRISGTNRLFSPENPCYILVILRRSIFRCINDVRNKPCLNLLIGVRSLRDRTADCFSGIVHCLLDLCYFFFCVCITRRKLTVITSLIGSCIYLLTVMNPEQFRMILKKCMVNLIDLCFLRSRQIKTIFLSFEFRLTSPDKFFSQTLQEDENNIPDSLPHPYPLRFAPANSVPPKAPLSKIPFVTSVITAFWSVLSPLSANLWKHVFTPHPRITAKIINRHTFLRQPVFSHLLFLCFPDILR